MCCKQPYQLQHLTAVLSAELKILQLCFVFTPANGAGGVQWGAFGKI